MQWLLPLMLMLMLVGCSTAKQRPTDKFDITVDAIASEAPKQILFTAKPAPGFEESDLRYQEFSQLVIRGLEQKGFKQATNASEAGIIVTVGYSISGPVESTHTRNKPYHQRNIVKDSWGVPVGSTTGVAYRQVTESYSYYTRKLLLKAFDAKSNVPVWEVATTSHGQSSDLRLVMPYLVQAASAKAGTNAHEEVSLSSK